ncbi:hypothetical protein MBLNU459_g6731t1 [Dothideomycetes sp. NU459]
MPVSHVGLTVSHLPSACSFFLSALQPLGYHYIGKQDDQVGFGVEDADFFLSPEITGLEASTAHIAFSAPSRVAVREFYAAALNAGGRPNGSPAARGEDDCLFNAAVLDLDGNSIEVIHREHVTDAESQYSGHSRVLAWSKGISGPETADDVVTKLPEGKSQRSLLGSAQSVITSITKSSKAPSKAPTVARSVSTSALPSQTRDAEPSTGITTQGLIGTLLGAAAGAAVAYAMVQSERDSARQELAFEADMRSQASQSSQKAPTNRQAGSKKSHCNLNSAESAAPEKRAHRNFSVTESAYSVPRKARTQLTLEAASSPQRIHEVDTNTYRSPTYVSLAPSHGPVRSAISKRAIDFAPVSEAPSSDSALNAIQYAPISYNRRPAMSGRSYTAPVDPRDQSVDPLRQIQDVPATQARQAEEQWAADDLVVARRDSAMNIPLPVSRNASLVSAADIQLPSSRKTSLVSAKDVPLPASQPPSVTTTARIPLPESRPGSLVGGILGRSNYYREPADDISAARVALPPSRAESFVSGRPGLEDMETVAPEDSISCVGWREDDRPRDRSKESRPVTRSMAIAKRTGPDFLFLANANSAKFKDMSDSPEVNVSIQSSSQDWISVTGTVATASNSDPRIEEVWNRGASAWFGDVGDGVHDGSASDPRMALIEVKAKYISYYKAEAGALGYVKEIVAANLTGGVANTGKLRQMVESEIAAARAKDGTMSS